MNCLYRNLVPTGILFLVTILHYDKDNKEILYLSNYMDISCMVVNVSTFNDTTSHLYYTNTYIQHTSYQCLSLVYWLVFEKKKLSRQIYIYIYLIEIFSLDPSSNIMTV